MDGSRRTFGDDTECWVPRFRILSLPEIPDQKLFIAARHPLILYIIVQRSEAEEKKDLTSMNRSSIPPTPPYSHAPPPSLPRSAAAGNHSRSFSQPPFSLESLPPLSPAPYPKSSPTSSLSDSGDMPAPFSSPAATAGLPPRKVHRRSSSDTPFGIFPIAPATVKPEPSYDGAGERKSQGNIGDDIFDAFLNFNGAYSSESEAESSAIDCGSRIAEAAAPCRHLRSISMDGLMSRLSFAEESHRVPPSPGSKRRQSSHDDPAMDGEFNLEFGNGEFSGTELKKIMADKRLEDIALSDPKRAKRMLANRQSAARSKERKMRYISELERKVQTLQTEATTLSAQLTFLKRDSAGLATQNSELKIRLQAMEQQAQLRDALSEALTSEVQRLRQATAHLDDSLPKQMKPATSIKS